MIFVSHDRYFVKKLADRLLVFEDDTVKMFEYGYDEYLEKTAAAKNTPETTQKTNEQVKEKPKKGFTTPLKEKSKCERALKKSEQKIAELEALLEELNGELQKEENIADYLKLGEINAKIEETEETLLLEMENWELLSQKLEEMG